MKGCFFFFMSVLGMLRSFSVKWVNLCFTRALMFFMSMRFSARPAFHRGERSAELVEKPSGP